VHQLQAHTRSSLFRHLPRASLYFLRFFAGRLRGGEGAGAEEEREMCERRGEGGGDGGGGGGGVQMLAGQGGMGFGVMSSFGSLSFFGCWREGARVLQVSFACRSLLNRSLLCLH
jgi:hypothetical protein